MNANLQSTDKLLSRIDSLLSTQTQSRASDLHLRVMALLDNPTQRALFCDWDCEIFEETQQDLNEVVYIEERVPHIFSNTFQAKRMLHTYCVVCDDKPATQEFNNLFCSRYCALNEPWFGAIHNHYFDSFYESNPDMPKPLHVSNLCVSPLFQLKRY